MVAILHLIRLHNFVLDAYTDVPGPVDRYRYRHRYRCRYHGIDSFLSVLCCVRIVYDAQGVLNAQCQIQP